MSYLSDWREAEEGAAAARAANPLCDQSSTCPAPDDGHLVGCRRNRVRLGLSGVASSSAPPAGATTKEADGE